MLNKLSGWDDTIVALSTAPGIAAIAIIRLSGEKAFRIINELFPSQNLELAGTHTLHVGILNDGVHDIDEVVVSLFKGPKSYTGEHVVEISCHGSPYIQQQVIQACMDKGARMAKAGEFTQRAFINGKLDLTQAEAVADLIASNTKASKKAALQNVKGGFSAILRQLREELVQFSALIELELDFSEEDVEFADRKKFISLLQSAQKICHDLMLSFQLGNVIKNGITVAIIGKPNAGKSTLLNTLLNENRAIVSEIAGTTRDTIEAHINIDGVIFRLIDTAGIRLHTTDEIEKIGVERSIEKMKAADIVLYIFDSNEMESEELKKITLEFNVQKINYLLVANKIDQQGIEFVKRKFHSFENVLFIAAKKNAGIAELKEELFRSTVHEPLVSENVIITNSRHYEALQQINNALMKIEEGLSANIPGDLLSLDIRHCLQFISELTGDVTSDTVLDYVFSKFCIGK